MARHPRLEEYRVYDIPGWMSDDELAWLYDQAHMWARRVPRWPWVEVGSYRGRSTAAVMVGALDGGLLRAADAILCVDTFDGRDTPGGEMTSTADGAATLCRTFRDRELSIPRILPSLSTVAARFVDLASVVFIDGAHDREHVSEDIAAWLPKIGLGGMICGHDYPSYGVGPAVNEAFGARVHQGPHSIWYVEV